MSGEQVPSVRIAVLGLGEAGGLIAADLRDAGARVQGYDPARSAPDGVADLPGEAAAASGCDLVLSVNSSKAAPEALEAGLAGTGPGTVWADLNTASPQLKRHLGETAAAAGITFADVSLMSPVPGRGLHTPMLASGPGAASYAELMGALGAGVEAMDAPSGSAAERKLLRSVFFKGLAAAVVEALEAGRAAGCEDWLRDNIADELNRADAGTVQRLVEGSRVHAARRADEMQAATDMLTDLGVAPLVSTAGRDLLQNLRDRA
ncbi:NAD(P)-dependent oxidoreductase [Streptomonospora salina]|uniref:3-hydroxyisobutyrate dehydrogenase-like beta-hydroxyacid dehydrogenase n=1 Tax=Streptomonospora salina TaxID=104205 RepID=A0A841EFG4_9ACTN|nr:NAD(P)-dependent oxidoreductase [Streptomonospora salina]MBB5999793.1 3-hydroxyisobutyrate dehydrogenase-like beta-hydroxyacid dehydrogenase [Streptomonospora salina]